MLALPDFSAAVAWQGVCNALVSAGISYLLVPIVAWIATLGRGYMPPLGFTLAMLALGQVFSKTGWAVWFPWSIVPLWIGAVGQPATMLAPTSLVVVALTFVIGVAATIAQLRFAETRSDLTSVDSDASAGAQDVVWNLAIHNVFRRRPPSSCREDAEP